MEPVSEPPDTSRPVLVIRHPEDALASVQVVLGFWPEQSIVMLTAGSRDTFHARVDMPTSDFALTETVEALVDPVIRNGAEVIMLLFYTDDESAARRALRAMQERARGIGVRVSLSMRIDGRRWFGIGPGFTRDERRLGTPFDLGCHPILAGAVLEGRPLLASRRELAAGLAPNLVQTAATAEELARLAEHGEPWPVARPPSSGELREEGRWLRLLVIGSLADDAVEVGSTRALIATSTVARVVAGVQQVRVRDAAWHLMCQADARQHLAWWTSVLRRTPVELCAPVAFLVGFSSWLAGDGARAWCAVDRGLAASPDYSGLALLAEMLQQAMAPSTWADSTAAASAWDEGLVG